MRKVSIIAILCFLSLLALLEVGLALPIAGWLYLTVACLYGLASLQLVPLRFQQTAVFSFGFVCTAVATLYYVPWSTRKPFLQHLNEIKVGMDETEVRKIMDRYHEGTGWPAIPPGTGTNLSAMLVDLSAGQEHATTSSPTGELLINDSMVFRHSTNSNFNSDWGIVKFKDGLVVEITFSPD